MPGEWPLPWPAQLGIYNQLALWSYFPQNPLFSSTVPPFGRKSIWSMRWLPTIWSESVASGPGRLIPRMSQYQYHLVHHWRWGDNATLQSELRTTFSEKGRTGKWKAVRSHDFHCGNKTKHSGWLLSFELSWSEFPLLSHFSVFGI